MRSNTDIPNLSRKVLMDGGAIQPIYIPAAETGGLGNMNPSVYVDGDHLIMNLRVVNYTLVHTENKQEYNNVYGPLVYLHPENDLTLRTTNYFLRLRDNLTVEEFIKVNTTRFDTEPKWEFVGLEDVRLVRWNDKLYMCGVRRDVKENGEGRIEMSEIVREENEIVEISRTRIEPPNPSYCEKNWMPIVDQPYHFVKWTNPTEVVEVQGKQAKTIVRKLPVEGSQNFRGGGQVIPHEGGYLGVVHESALWRNVLKQKDATYTHRFVVWDNEWHIKHISKSFSFLGGEIEFCAGLAEYQGNYLLSFGFQDNAAYILSIPKDRMYKYVYYD